MSGAPGPVPPGRARAQHSFAWSVFGAAARGTGLIAVAVAIGIVLLQYGDDPPATLAGGEEPAAEMPVAPAEPTTTTVTTAGPRPPAEVTVLVLNASGRAGQAGMMSDRLGVVGYRTLDPGNAPRRPETTVSCRPGLEREAPALAAATGVEANTEELDDDSGLPGAEAADCVVILGTG